MRKRFLVFQADQADQANMAFEFGYNYNQRDQRLNSNIKTLYHQTDHDSANKILNSGYMLRGSSGLGGGGIYFATSVHHTNHKAIKKGVVLRCKVKLGKVKQISKYGDYDITFDKLSSEGYDSVLIPRDNGHEYVVYNWDQVEAIGVEADSTNSLSQTDKKYQITKKTVDDMVKGKSKVKLEDLDTSDKWEILYNIIDHPELYKKG